MTCCVAVSLSGHDVRHNQFFVEGTVALPQASLLLGEQCVMPSAMHLVAITQPVEGLRPGDQPGERVLRKVCISDPPPPL